LNEATRHRLKIIAAANLHNPAIVLGLYWVGSKRTSPRDVFLHNGSSLSTSSDLQGTATCERSGKMLEGTVRYYSFGQF
jgi:hypothetical protein